MQGHSQVRDLRVRKWEARVFLINKRGSQVKEDNLNHGHIGVIIVCKELLNKQ